MNLLQMSITSGLLILLILVLRIFAIDRLPKTMFIMLWSIALFRLIVPFSIPSKLGFYNKIIDFTREIFLPKVSIPDKSTLEGNIVFKDVKSMEMVVRPFYMETLSIIWLAGSVLLVIFFAVSFLRAYRKLGTALPLRGSDLIDQWLAEQRFKRPLKILISDRITTPLTYGILKPKIILPKSINLKNELQTRYILAHETIHIKRFDALWKLLLVAAMCIHWFNPMVWLLYFLMNRDLEISCDERVIRLFGEKTKSDYAMSLIEMAEHRAGFAPLYSSFSKNATEERIMSIMKFKKTSVTSLIFALIFILGASSVFAQNVHNVIRSHGIIQTENGVYTFDIDENGVVTVSNAEGDKVSTSVMDSNGVALLKDGSGNVISKIEAYTQEKISTRESLPFFGASVASPSKIGTVPPPPEYIFTADKNNVITVTDTDGNIVGTGTIDSKGNAVIKDSSGASIGNVNVQNGEVIRFSLRINGTNEMDIAGISGVIGQ